MPDLRKALAALSHAVWARWAHQLMGEEKLSVARVKRWRHLIDMPFDQLTDEEKKPDYLEADRVLALLAEAPQDAGLREKVVQELLNYDWESASMDAEECGELADRILALLPAPDALREAFVAGAMWGMSPDMGPNSRREYPREAEKEAARRFPKEG